MGRQNAAMTSDPPFAGLILRPAGPADLPALATLNRQLLEDESHRAVPSVEQLLDRHRGWMETGAWLQDILELDRQMVGYIVHATQLDHPTIHVQQYCIDRGRRGRGFGRAGFALFMRERAVPGMRVTLDVLESNPAGRAFWRAIGCRPYFQRLEIVAGGG